MSDTTQRILQPRTNGDFYQLSVVTNGGIVLVEYPVGTSWVTATSIASNGSHLISALSTSRITPSGGAEYDIK